MKRKKIIIVTGALLLAVTIALIILFSNYPNPDEKECVGTMAETGYTPEIGEVGEYTCGGQLYPNHNTHCIFFSGNPSGGSTYCYYSGPGNLHYGDNVVCTGFNNSSVPIVQAE